LIRTEAAPKGSGKKTLDFEKKKGSQIINEVLAVPGLLVIYGAKYGSLTSSFFVGNKCE
jgi:hypothetical protein